MLEYERLEQDDLFSTIKRNAVSCDIVTVLVHNVRSLPRHGGDILSDNRHYRFYGNRNQAIRFY